MPRSQIRNQLTGSPAQIEEALARLSPAYVELAKAAGSSPDRYKDLLLFVEEVPRSVRETLSPNEIYDLFVQNERLNTGHGMGSEAAAVVIAGGSAVGTVAAKPVTVDRFLNAFWTPKSQIAAAYEKDGTIYVLAHQHYDGFVRSGLPGSFHGKRIVVVETTRANSIVHAGWHKAHKENYYPPKPVVLLTGSTSGLGLAMAKQLVKMNYRVILTGRKSSLASLRDAGIVEGPDVKILPLDITSASDRETVVAKAIEEWGGVDVLINNASITHRGSVEDTNLASAREQMETDYLGPRELSRAVLPLMRLKGRGQIINISSIAGQVPLPMMETYSAAKAALDAHTEALSKEVAPFGVKVSLAQVSILPTEGLQRVRGTGAADDPKGPYHKPELAAGDFSHWAAAQTDATPDSVAKNILGKVGKPNPPFHIRPSTDSKLILLAQRYLPGFLFRAFIRNSLPHYQNWGQIDPPGVRPGTMNGPLPFLQQGVEFGRNFVGDMKARAQAITSDPDAVERRLKDRGLSQPYVQPKNKANVKLEGKLVVEGTLGEFFELWGSWIEKGYGSINDRQYADLILQYRDWVRQFPALAKMPMSSEDAFTASIVDGKMVLMTERTIAKLAGLIPTSQVDWVYRRKRDPVASNSFERKIDDFNGDVDKLQAFYRELFDPKHVPGAAGARVVFKVKRVDSLPESPPSDKEFEHGVFLPGGFGVPSALTGGPQR